MAHLILAHQEQEEDEELKLVDLGCKYNALGRLFDGGVRS